MPFVGVGKMQFQSTHPVWGATTLLSCVPGFHGFQSTHPVWGATRPPRPRWRKAGISIHAPRVGCDWAGTTAARGKSNFNPRTPCGVRPMLSSRFRAKREFQSTHPVWGATKPHLSRLKPSKFQSTHPVWGATAAPRAGPATADNFNPRTPCGVRPRMRKRPGDHKNFNPRTPCGVRQTGHWRLWGGNQFQSTHPVWGATQRLRAPGERERHFNPRTPCGVRHGGAAARLPHHRPISIHAPRVGCDPHSGQY